MKEPITREQYESIELYLYGLRIYTESDEFSSLTLKHRVALSKEMIYMEQTFAILSNIFEPTKSPRRSVVAWKKRDEKYCTEYPVYHFTSAQVAAKALDVVSEDICRVAGNRRNATGGYRFMYLTDFEALNLTVTHEKSKFAWLDNQ